MLPAGLTAPAAKWTGLAKYSFVGGNNDPEQVPVEGLIDAENAVLRREGRTLATFAPALRVGFIKLYQAALKAGVAINPGPERSTDKAYAGSRLRLCFASPSHEKIREGIATLAEVCRREFGVPVRSANVKAQFPT
jgi:hypothetical protein